MRVGILGGGQLGRMMALAGYPLGISCTVLDPSSSPCAAQVCGHVRGEFENDFAAMYALAQVSDVITFEFENVPMESARWLAERVPVFPPPRALEVSQDPQYLAGWTLSRQRCQNCHGARYRLDTWTLVQCGAAQGIVYCDW